MSVNGATDHQAVSRSQTKALSSSQTKCVNHADAVPPVWCSAADDLINADDFRLAVMKNDLKLIEIFLKHGKCQHFSNIDALYKMTTFTFTFIVCLESKLLGRYWS